MCMFVQSMGFSMFQPVSEAKAGGVLGRTAPGRDGVRGLREVADGRDFRDFDAGVTGKS